MITTVVIELYYQIGKKSTLLKGCSDSANESNLLSNLFREEVPYQAVWYVTANPKTGEVHEPSPKLSYESFLAVLEGSLSQHKG